VLFQVVAALRAGAIKSTGKLHSELCPTGVMSRDSFENVLGAMARAGLVRLSDAVFEKDGKQIPYRRVSLTRVGLSANEETPIQFIMKVVTPASAKRRDKKRSSAETKSKHRTKQEKVGSNKPALADVYSTSDARVEAALLEWRMAEARRRRIPAFRIFSDKALQGIVSQRPRTAQELLAISGIGIATAEKYGQQIYRIVNDNHR
jgi:superfamily II DNA helicase RecQ